MTPGRAAQLDRAGPPRLHGRLTGLGGLAMRAALAGVRLGEVCEVDGPEGPILAEVIGLAEDRAVLLPLAPATGVSLDAEVRPTGGPLSVLAGEGLLGRVLDGLGRPLDGRPLPGGLARWPVDRPAPAPLSRPLISAPLRLGVRALDGLLTAGRGQRLGLFAGPGVGKSALLGRIARAAAADACVVCLVGERGREVREFVEDALGPEGLARSVVVAATSDQPPLVRLRSAQVATALAEWLAETGREVLLLCDSLTRVARAQREVGLAAGELPARQGYPPSVFEVLPRLVERAGRRARGGVTAIYTVLVAGGDLDEPVADEVRGLLDGHVVLDRRLAERGHYPAIDVLASVSRVMDRVASPEHRAAAARVRELLAAWAEVRELVLLGAWRPGADPAADEAVARWPAIEAFLRQGPGEEEPLATTVARLAELAA